MTQLKKLVFASITVLLSTALTFLLLNLMTNFFALQLFNQDVFPRSWNNSVGMFYRTLSVQAHDEELDNWTALLGDSYAEGAGDAYLAGIGNYNIAHFLHEQSSKNILIFARSGFGSISAVREFELAKAEFSKSLFLPDLDAPDEIILLFYEGNDLTDNLRYLNSKNVGNLPLREFVAHEIAQPSDIRRKTDFYLPLVRPTYLLGKSIVTSFSGSRVRGSEHSYNTPGEDKTVTNRFKFKGNGSKPQTIVVEDRIQSAATELSQESIDLALEVLFHCLDYLSESYSDVEVTVVYIPSPVTIYSWHDPVRIKTELYSDRDSTSKQENDENSLYIRARISAYSEVKGVHFIDTTERLQAKSILQNLHGPRDWNHFNSAGYEFVSTMLD